MILRRRLLVAVLVAVSACAGTNTARTSGAHFVTKGIYTSSSPPRRVPDSLSPTGARGQRPDTIWLVDTATIPAALGTAFGVGFRVTVPNIDTVRTTVTWRFPAAGLSNPRTGETTYVYSREVECTPYQVCRTGWTFEEAWELVPGIWEVEIAIGSRPPIRQSFTVVP
jgi:hypothetical protein